MPEHVLFRQLDDEAVLLNLDTGRYYGFDEVGLRMWRALSETDDVEQAKKRLLAEYDVAPARLETDFKSWIAALENHGLLVWCNK